MNGYGVFLDLTGKRVLVVGAGSVATRRIDGLLAAGAAVEVVAPEVSEQVAAWAELGAITWQPRAFRASDVDGAWLVHTATGDTTVDSAVLAAAAERRVWAVRASDAASSPAWTAATVARDGVVVAVNGGGDPRRAKALRDGIAAGLANGDLPLRRRRKPGPDGGRVALIGAGPGDPDLMTVRGRRLLRQADVVVTDHLVPASVLSDLDPDVEVRYAGKRPGHHSWTQDQINAFVVQRALEGHRVVRLKGGDPFLLGRGGEEALACLRSGVPVEVVPGVTSAFAVPAAAGIPVTHRGLTSSVVVLSGHEGPVAAGEVPREATLVLMMGTRTLRSMAAALVDAGRDPATPAAVIERGWTPRQRTLVGTLADIADIAERGGATSPAVVVVGQVVALRSVLGDLAAASADSGHALPEHTRDSPARRPALVG